MGNDGSNGLSDFACGSAAGAISKVFEHPFDLCKVRLQSQPPDRPARFKGPIDCLTQTWSKEGVKGLYRGLSAPIFGAAAENAALFTVYGKLQEAISYAKRGTADVIEGSGEEKSLGELALAAAAAGATASFLLTPIELIKVKMQVTLLATEGLLPSASASPSPSSSLPSSSASSAPHSAPPPAKPDFKRLPGPFTILRQIIVTKGLRGLWLGQTGTLLRETGGSSAWFTGFEVVSRMFMRRREVSQGLEKGSVKKADLKAWELCCAGGFAGMAYNVLFPADTIKSALQTNAELRPHLANASFISTGKEIFASRGIKGLYAGCGITVARSVPSSAMIFLIYENLSRYFA